MLEGNATENVCRVSLVCISKTDSNGAWDNPFVLRLGGVCLCYSQFAVLIHTSAVNCVIRLIHKVTLLYIEWLMWQRFVAYIIRLNLRQSQPDKAGLKCPSVHPCVRTYFLPSIRPQIISLISMKFGM